RTAGYMPQMSESLRRFVGALDAEPDWYALALPANGKAPADAPGARLVGADLVQEVGDSGCANVLLNLALALAKAEPGQRIVAQAYGSGAGTVSALIEVAANWDGAAPARNGRVELDYVGYAKHRGLIPLTKLPSFGAPYAA